MRGFWILPQTLKIGQNSDGEKNRASFAFWPYLEGDNNKQRNSRRLIYYILLLYAKVKTVKPIDALSWASFSRYSGSKLAETAIVTEIEHFWHFGHFQRGIVMK